MRIAARWLRVIRRDWLPILAVIFGLGLLVVWPWWTVSMAAAFVVGYGAFSVVRMWRERRVWRLRSGRRGDMYWS